MLVLTVGNGVNGFTLCPQLGEFMLTHPALRCPPTPANSRSTRPTAASGKPPVKRYVTNAWPAAPAARPRLQHALDRLHGGRGAPHPDARRRVPVPARQQGPSMPGRLRLLYEANPIGF
jgi:fructose-1,6-bisphosphatase I/sedoheptulose-1,7-bisphosphatase